MLFAVVAVAEEPNGLFFPIGTRLEDEEHYVGSAHLYEMIEFEEVFNLPEMNNVTFEPAARTNWHSHEGGELLLVTSGVGYYQEEGQPAKRIRRGDVIEIAPNTTHWHGATPDNWMAQVEVAVDPEQPGITWLDTVADDEYLALEAEEFAERPDTVDGEMDFMFERGSDAMSMDSFTGSVYLSSVTGRDSAIGAPSMSYVVFEPTVINNWHIHGGGQVLIATDGIGYHQIEGEPVEVLYPGDVALCPPGEKHWHGGIADGWFAHIAIGTNPGMGGVQWLEPVTDKVYQSLPKEKE